MSDQMINILKTGKRTGGDERSKQALDFVTGASVEFVDTLLEQEKQEMAEKEREEQAKKLKDSLETNQFLLSDVTGGRLPKSGIDRIFTRFAGDFFPEAVRCDIPEVNPDYRWDPDVLEAMWLGYYLNIRTLSVGPPGSGKTTASHQLAALLHQPFARFNGKDGIEGSSFLGYPWATKAGMEWKDGLMPQCVRGDYIVVIDEIMKLPPGIQMCMQSLYEEGGFLMLDDKPGTIADKHVYPSEHFRLFATDNTKGTGDSLDKYAAGQFQDVSSLDRFGITIEVDYMAKHEESAMLMQRFPATEVSTINKVVALANLVREAFKQGNLAVTLSPRGLMTMLRFIENGLSLENAARLSFVNKLGDDREVEVANKFLTQCI